MEKEIHIHIDINRVSPQKIQAISNELTAIGIDFEHTGVIKYDDTDLEIIKKIREILERHLLLK